LLEPPELGFAWGNGDLLEVLQLGCLASHASGLPPGTIKDHDSVERAARDLVQGFGILVVGCISTAMERIEVGCLPVQGKEEGFVRVGRRLGCHCSRIERHCQAQGHEHGWRLTCHRVPSHA
jgi:hypothetical protein